MKPILVAALIFLWSCTTIIAQEQQGRSVNEQLVEYYQTQRYADALTYLKHTYPEPVMDKKILSGMAYTSQMAGKLADAENYYQRIYELDTANMPILFNLGNINLRKGNNLKAKGYFLKLLQKDSTWFIVYKNMAQIALDEDDTKNTITYLEKANKLQPTEPDVATELSAFYIGQKKYNQAEHVLDIAIAADNENIFLLESLVKLLYAQQKWKDVIMNGEMLFQLGDNAPAMKIKVGEAYFYAKNYDCGIETLLQIPVTVQNESTFYFIAECYKGLKNQTLAIEYFNKAIDEGISPNIDAYYSEIADSYTILKKSKNAALAYQKALQFNENPMTYYLLANLYDTGLKNKASALKYYRKYVAANPPAIQRGYVDYSKSRITALAN